MLALTLTTFWAALLAATPMLAEVASTPLEDEFWLLALMDGTAAIEAVAVADGVTGVHLLQGGQGHGLHIQTGSRRGYGLGVGAGGHSVTRGNVAAVGRGVGAIGHGVRTTASLLLRTAAALGHVGGPGVFCRPLLPAPTLMGD